MYVTKKFEGLSWRVEMIDKATSDRPQNFELWRLLDDKNEKKSIWIYPDCQVSTTH